MATNNAVDNILSGVTGSGSFVGQTSPLLITPNLGTATAGVLTNCIGLPVSTGISGLGTGIATFLGTPSSANLLAALTDKTGTGVNVFATSPSLVTPNLGTPASGVLTSCTGLPISTGVSGLGTGIATFLATPSSANLIAAMSDETGTGALVFANTPTLISPILGAASATSIAFTSTSGIIGTTTNNNAAAGSVGEVIESLIPSGTPVSLSTGTAANVTSVSLTAGDWDVWGSVVFAPGGATTYTAFAGCIGTTSASFSGAIPGPYFSLTFPNTTFSAGNSQAFPVGQKRFSLASTTTIYLVVQANFAVSTLGAYGDIVARRAR